MEQWAMSLTETLSLAAEESLIVGKTFEKWFFHDGSVKSSSFPYPANLFRQIKWKQN